MIVYAVFVITTDGRTILDYYFQSIEGVVDSILFGGCFAALQSMTGVMTNSEAEISSIEIEGFSYHIRSFGLFWIVIVTDLFKNPDEIMQILGFRFIKEYGDILMQMDFNLNVFKPFKKEIHEIIRKETVIDESKSIKPALKLGTAEIFSLPHELQATALTLISLEMGTIEDIAQESGENIADTRRNVITLQNMGFLGKKQVDIKTLYFCSI